MSNQPTPPTFRVLVFELWDNGKIICPAFPPIHADQLISTQELKQIRDYVDLIIANPQNFHIVRPEPIYPGSEGIGILDKEFPKSMREKLINGNWNPLCNKCDNVLISDTEKGTGICFDCEKKGILAAVNKPLTEDEIRLMEFIKNDKDGECQAVECDNKRFVCSYFCNDHANYVGKLKELPKKIKVLPVTHMTQPLS